jgi:hypothetical protein
VRWRWEWGRRHDAAFGRLRGHLYPLNGYACGLCVGECDSRVCECDALVGEYECDALVGDHEARVGECDVTRFTRRVNLTLASAVESHDGSCVMLSPVNESASANVKRALVDAKCASVDAKRASVNVKLDRASVSERCLACAPFP